ncbi:MAG: flavodoxin family protein [Planctomycetia bacterium]|jgi:multimeric flavodoxin WrbA
MKVVAIIGTYRKGKVIDQTVGHILEAAEAAGTETERFYLIDEEIHFCDNCRACCQKPGPERGVCVWDNKENHPDAMAKMLDAIEAADALVVASPMNAGLVTATTKRFAERQLPLYYWPWGTLAPKKRRKGGNKKAVTVTSSAMPAVMGRLLTPVLRTLRKMAKSLGAKKTKTLYVGLAAGTLDYELSKKVIVRAKRLGTWLGSK